MTHFHFTSVTRIANLSHTDVVIEALDRASWRRGQYVAAAVTGESRLPYDIERVDGRLAAVTHGDVIIGVLGTRAATLECVGDWAAVGEDLVLESLTMAGVLGRCTSRSPFAKPVIPLQYLGHLRGPQNLPLAMDQFASTPPARSYEVSTVLITGTSMSAGKTYAAGQVIRALSGMGLEVAGAKLAGVGRYSDALSMSDAGAANVFDFCDAGLPSTVVPTKDYQEAITPLLSTIAATEPDVAVIEAGASPLEPYNGDTCAKMLRPHTRCIILAASDPYAATGFMSTLGITPDLITGRTTTTSAAIDLTRRLTGVPVLDLLDPASSPPLRSLLVTHLGLDPGR